MSSARFRGGGDLEGGFLQVTRESLEVSHHLERGQSKQPVTEVFERLIAEKADALRVSLLALTPVAVAPALNWLAGGDREVAAVLPTDPVVLYQINSSSLRRANDTPAPVPVDRSGDWHDVHVLFASSCDVLLDDPGVYQQFCTHGHLLVVALDDNPPAEEEVSLLADASEMFEVVLPLLVSQHGDLRDIGGAKPVLRAHRGSLPPLQPGPGGESEPGLFTDPRDPLRQALVFSRRLRDVVGAVDSLANRFQREQKQLTVRQAGLETQRKALGDAEQEERDQLFSAVVERINEQIDALDRAITGSNERDVQTLGDLSGLVRNLVSQIQVASLNVERNASFVKLKLNAEHLARINRIASEALHERLHGDVATIGRQIQATCQEAETDLRTASGQGVSLRPPPLHADSIWHAAQNMIAIGKESTIELKRKGIFDVLTAGRQKVFILIMLISLAGRFGLGSLYNLPTEVKWGFGAFLLVIFLVSAVNAVLAWRREKVNQTEKEMEKIKEALTTEGQRVMDQVMKVKLTQFRDYLKDTTSTLERQIDDVATKCRVQFRNARDVEQGRLEETRRSLDTRLRELSDVERRVERLQRAAREQQDECRLAIRESVRQMAARSGISERSHPDVPPPVPPDSAPATETPTAAPSKHEGDASSPPRFQSGFAERRAARTHSRRHDA